MKFTPLKDTQMDITEKSNTARDKLIDDLKTVIKEAESLLKNSDLAGGDSFKNAKAKFESTLSTVKNELADWDDAIRTTTRDAADATDQYVRDHPWQSVGLGAAVGVICGLLISRR
ncbi:YqjD family protein [Undibacterium arcticum]